jgi:hypothetical protein
MLLNSFSEAFHDMAGRDVRPYGLATEGQQLE